MLNVSKNKSSLFLMEIIAVTLFFTIGAVICIKIFWEGQKLSIKSNQLTNATIEVQNAAQLIKHGRGDTEAFDLYYGTEDKDGVSAVYFDENFEVCDIDKGKYNMYVTIDGNDLISYNIRYNNISSGEEIFAITSKVYKEAEK